MISLFQRKYIAAVIVFAAAILTLSGWRQAVNPAMINRFFQDMILSHEAQREKAYDGFYRDMKKIRSEVPQGSTILMPWKGMESDLWKAPFCAYFLFPHLVMTDGSSVPEGQTGAVYHLSVSSSGIETPLEINLRFRPYELRLVRPAKTEPVSVWIDFSDLKLTVKSGLEVTAKFILLIFTGGLLTSGPSFRFGAGMFADCFSAGTAMFGITALCLGIAGLPVLGGLHLVLMSLGAALVRLIFFRGRQIRMKVSESRVFSVSQWTVIPVVILAVLFLKSIRTPLLDWDDCAIWGIKAKLLFATHDLASLGLAGDWRQYPPLLPLLTAYFAGAGEVTAKLVVPCFSAALLLITRRELARYVSSGFAAVLAGGLILTPLIFYHSWNLSSNLFLTFFITQSVLILSSVGGSNKAGDFMRASLAGFGMVFSRIDGVVHWMLLLLAFWISRKWKGAGVRSLILLMPVAAFFLWLAYIAEVYRVDLLRLWRFDGYEPMEIVESPAVQLVMGAKKFLDLRTFAGVTGAFLVGVFLRWNFFWKRYNFECLYIGFAGLWLVLFSFKVIPLWGARFYLETGFPRYAMVLLPIFFILTVKTVAGEIFKTSPQPNFERVP